MSIQWTACARSVCRYEEGATQAHGEGVDGHHVRARPGTGGSQDPASGSRQQEDLASSVASHKAEVKGEIR